MNSVILSFLGSFFSAFWRSFKESGTYRLFDRIYGAVSRSWANSGIMTFLRKDRGIAYGAKSAVYRVCHFPFTLLELLNQKLGVWLRKMLERSCIVNWGRYFMHSFLAVNTRFFGMMFAGAAIGYGVLHFVQGGGLSKGALVLLVVGLLLSLVHYNAMGFLDHSRVVEFCKAASAFEQIHFHFYDEDYTKGKTPGVLALLTGLAGGILATKSVLLLAALPAAIFGGCLVLYAPVVGVYLAVFAAPLLPTMTLAGLCVLTAFSLVIKSIATPYFKWRTGGLGTALILFLGVLLATSVLSFAPVKSTTVWIMYFIFVGFYFVILNTIKTKEQLWSLMKVLVISGALVALYGIMQYLFGWTTSNAWIDEEMFEDATMRVYSTLGNPNVLGEYLLLVLPVAAVFLVKYPFKKLSKWVYGAAFLVTALCLVLTQSRGCWLGFILAAFVFVTFYNGRWWGLLPIVLILLPFVVPQSVVERLTSVGNLEDSSTSYRVFIWMGTLGLLRNYWIGGIGMGEGAFNMVYPFYSYNAIIAPHSHNLFLQLTVEGGIVALALFIAMMVIFLKNCALTYRSVEKKTLESIAAVAFGSGILGFLLQSMFDYTFYNYRVMAVFFMVLAMGTVLYQLVKGREA